MSGVDTAGIQRRQFLSIDISWRNIVFSLRTAVAAIAALALAYRLELSDPQWATLTVYILAQPTVGGALGKGAWRAVGTLAGGLLGLVLVAVFSQTAELLVAVTATAIGLCFYAGARLKSTMAYAFLLGGYTMVLVSFEGSTHPLQAWSIAVDRTSEILIGITCSAVVSAIVWPRYAGNALREALSHTFSGLATYVATALRAQATPDFFAQMRQRMVAEVVSFDTLRSSTLFETAEMRPNAQRLRSVVHEFLTLLSIARGLFRRVDAFEKDEARQVLERVRPALDAAVLRIERLSAERSAWKNARELHREVLATRAILKSTAADLENQVGTAPFDVLANGLLILRRTGDVLHALAMVALTETTISRGPLAQTGRLGHRDPQERREAIFLAVRAALAILLLSVVWMATGWNEGFTAVSGGAIVLLLGVNQDNPQAGARSYLAWSSIGTVLGYVVLILVAPHLQDFGALSIILLLVLLPAGLMAGTPSHTWAGIAFGAFTISQIGIGNVFRPDEVAIVNSAVALILGMVICLAVISVMPVTSQSRRSKARYDTLGTILPAVARNEIVPRRGARQITGMLASLLPRLALDRQRDEDFFRGMLGAASMAVELGRLTELGADPAMPPAIAADLAQFMHNFALGLEGIARRADLQASLAATEEIVARMRATLCAPGLVPGETARSLLRASASLRFIADRFDVDGAFFEYGSAEDEE